MHHITLYFDLSPASRQAFDALPQALLGLDYWVRYQPVWAGGDAPVAMLWMAWRSLSLPFELPNRRVCDLGLADDGVARPIPANQIHAAQELLQRWRAEALRLPVSPLPAVRCGEHWFGADLVGLRESVLPD